MQNSVHNIPLWSMCIKSLSLSTVVLSIGMGPMPAIVDRLGYDVQKCSSSRPRPIIQTQKKLEGVLVQSVTTRDWSSYMFVNMVRQ